MTYSITIDKQPSGEIEIIGDFSDNPIVLSSIGHEVIISINDISGLQVLNALKTTIVGENNTRKLEMCYRISITDKPNKWSDWIKLDPNGDSTYFVEVTPFYDYNIEIKFTRMGSNEHGEIKIIDFTWSGTWNADVIEEPVIDLPPGESIVFSVTDTYKVFELYGYDLVERGGNNDLNIDYRISQDNKRSWSEWTILTQDNIKTHKIDPIRFFNIQYRFTNNGSGVIKVRDLNLEGSFINITQNYTKSNRIGLRENCKNGLIGNTGLDAGSGSNSLTMGSNLKSSDSIWSTISCDEGDLFNPYNLGQAIDLYEKLSDDVTKIGGWKVEYFRTDPDENGIDHSIHEYSLHGVVATGDVKIMVPDNQFPSNQVAFNQFDLALMESFEVHLTKGEFKEIFGAQYRPKKEDFLWFCDLSRMYRVDHAQAIRDFGNSSVYYKLILGKYNQRANVKATTTTIQERINDIVKNSTLDELFGTDKSAHKKEVANKEQFETLSTTHERIRSSINANVERDLIDNAELVLSKYNYDLDSVKYKDDAVVYQKSDIYLKKGENRSFIAWVKFPEYYDIDANNDPVVYNLLNNFNIDIEMGYKFDIIGGELISTFNKDEYKMDISQHLDDDIWYCILININQRQRKISHHLYKRNVNREIDAKNLNSTKLRLLESNESPYVPVEYELTDNELMMSIKGSPMRITNIRVFDDVIPDDQHTKILNQQIVRDSDHAILADNANRIYALPNYPYHGGKKTHNR